MDRENIEAYRKEARRMEGGRGAGRGARVGPRPALMTAEVPRHSFASLPPPWGSLRLPSPHRLVRVMRPGYYLFPLVCARSTRSSRQTNNLPFERRHCRPTGSTLSLSLSLSSPTTARPHLSSSFAMRRFFYRIVNRWMWGRGGVDRREDYVQGGSVSIEMYFNMFKMFSRMFVIFVFFFFL